MSNVLSKLSKASADAAPVIIGERVPGMHFNPLQHDEVQAVAMKALKANKLYPVCEYENELKDNYIFIKCNMKIYDAEDPKQFIEIERPASIEIEYINENNKIINEEKNGYEARILQHEIDHLSGKLFVDYLSSVKRNILIKKVQKLKKIGEV